MILKFTKGKYLLWAVLLMAHPALGQGPAEGESSRAEPSPTATLSLQLRNMELLEVFKLLAERGNLNIAVSSEVKGTITLFLGEVSVKDALDIIVEINDLAYVTERGVINIMSDKRYELVYGRPFRDRATMEVFKLQHAEAKQVNDVLKTLGSKSGNIIADERTNTLIVIDLPDNLRQMREVVDKLDLPVATRIFTLQFTTSRDIEKIVKPLLSSQGRVEADPQTNKIIVTDASFRVEQVAAVIREYDAEPSTETEVFSLKYADHKEVEAKLAKELTPGVGRMNSDEQTNKIIVTDLPETLKRVREIIAALDERTLQVLIEAKIVQVSLSDQYKLGVDWEGISSRFDNAYAKAEFRILTSDDPGLRATAGTLGEHGYTALLEMLQTVGETELLSTPRIATLNHQEAKILVGSRVPYKTEESREEGGIIRTFEKVTMVDVGVSLYVTPEINTDGFVTMRIRPEVSSVIDYSEDIPVVETSESETSIMVKDGATIVIAGLIKDEKRKVEKRIPILGSIPLLGIPFRSTDDKKVKTELVIFLTPHIITGETPPELSP